jgi:Cytochrome c554 and c-prime
MSSYPRRILRWIPIAVMGLLTFVILLGEEPGRGQPPNALQVQPGNAPRPTPFPNRSTGCKNCHNQDERKSYTDEELAAMICRMTEWKYYDKRDKHQIAYAALAGPRSQSMVKLMGYKDKDATTVDACLRCHSVPEWDGVSMEAGFRAEGVTCVACHGPYREWVLEHQDAPILRRQRAGVDRPKDAPRDWLDFKRDEKEKLKGMTDLWDPARRVEVCASCHVGNYEQKKILTHEMYAAGHPPLPGFETVNFSEFQPRHWQYLREKSKDQQTRLVPYNAANLEHAELVAVSGPVLLRESMRLFASQAKADQNVPPGAAFPDFARYDCRACHHELKSDAFVQNRAGLAGVGRPGDLKWTHVLTRLGISIMTPEGKDVRSELAEYESRVKEFRDSMFAHPFGDKTRARTAAEALAAWADGLIKHRPSVTVSADKAQQLLVQLCSEIGTASLDYDSARQFAWAFRAIYDDLAQTNPQKAKNSTIESILDQIDKELLTTIPTAGEQKPIEESLPIRSKAVANFEISRVAKLFGELKQQVIPAPAH